VKEELVGEGEGERGEETRRKEGEGRKGEGGGGGRCPEVAGLLLFSSYSSPYIFLAREK
jgi:hypothetical protein